MSLQSSICKYVVIVLSMKKLIQALILAFQDSFLLFRSCPGFRDSDKTCLDVEST